jgi:hypothetical protein
VPACGSTAKLRVSGSCGVTTATPPAPTAPAASAPNGQLSADPPADDLQQGSAAAHVVHADVGFERQLVRDVDDGVCRRVGSDDDRDRIQSAPHRRRRTEEAVRRGAGHGDRQHKPSGEHRQAERGRVEDGGGAARSVARRRVSLRRAVGASGHREPWTRGAIRVTRSSRRVSRPGRARNVERARSGRRSVGESAPRRARGLASAKNIHAAIDRRSGMNILRRLPPP